jgi:hypothetical protein
MFPELYNKIKHTITQLATHFKWNLNTHAATGRSLKINKLDALVLALYQHRSTRATKKSVYEDFNGLLNCSYKTLVTAINNAGVHAMKFLFLLMRLGRKHAHLVKYTDATDIPVCLAKNATKHKTMKGLAEWGYSGKGFYYGLKMTMTRDDNGRMLALRFTAANGNDRAIFKEINRDIEGIIVADAGYVSKQLEQDMYIEGRRFVLIKPQKKMKKLCTAWQYQLYKRRFKIEFDFRNLKLFHGLVTSLPRSVNGYIANYAHALLSFVIA